MEMLKRSKMVPITVKGCASWACYPSAGDKAATAALEQLPRIEHLTLTARGFPKVKELLSSLSGAAPLLHTFHITLEDYSLDMPALPENIFSGPGGAPQLRCLSLTGCNANWKSEFLRSLTHLTVARLSTGCRLSVDELITNLGNMPQLENIHLCSVMAPPEHNSSSSPSTHLPVIARIHLEEKLMGCLAFFTTLTYPNTTIVSIKCCREDYHTDNIAPGSVRALISTISAKNIVPITSLCVENLCRGMFQGQDSQGIRRIFIEFQDISFQSSSISWDSLTLHHLKSLRVAGIYIPWSVWLGLFGKLKTLKTIFITDHANEFLDVLSRGDPAMVHATPASSPVKLKFTALKSLSLSGMDERELPWVEKLALCLRERRKRGLNLRRLCIEGFGDGADVVCQLGSPIKHVKWREIDDSEEETSDEEDEEEDLSDSDYSY